MKKQPKFRNKGQKNLLYIKTFEKSDSVRT